MRLYTVLRLAFALFLLYVAWPFIPTATSSLSKFFWGLWLGLFFLVIGGNLATLLKLSQPPVMEQGNNEKQEKREIYSRERR